VYQCSTLENSNENIFMNKETKWQLNDIIN
jgi:hypothetical protein